MSVEDLHDLELLWPSLLPTNVIVTGTFDQWSSSIHLVKGDTGFFGTVKVPWGEKVAYKFIVDGLWRCRDDRPQEDDGNGNINNVLRTPEKPQAVFPAVPGPPPRLSIPSEGVQTGGYGDIETMVTAIDFLPPAEPATVKGSLPFSIPQISVDALGLTPSANTPVSVSKLDTATATEGTVPPASKLPSGFVPFEQAPFSSSAPVLPVTDNGSVSLPSVTGDQDLHGFAIHVPTQFTKGEPVATEVVQEGVSAPSESAVLQSNNSLQGAPDVPAPIDVFDVPSTPTPVAVLGSTAKQTEMDLRRQDTPSTSSPSTPTPSTLTHKKRRSLFARIKHIFDKDSDKRERKEKNKH